MTFSVFSVISVVNGFFMSWWWKDLFALFG